jgi:hypothetical protein
MACLPKIVFPRSFPQIISPDHPSSSSWSNVIRPQITFFDLLFSTQIIVVRETMPVEESWGFASPDSFSQALS